MASTVLTALGIADSIGTSLNSLNNGLSSVADYYSIIKRVEEVLLLKEKNNPLQREKLILKPE